MRDSKDSSTVDLFSHARRVGRPCTSTDIKRKQDAAERARRYRESRKLPDSSIQDEIISLMCDMEIIAHSIKPGGQFWCDTVVRIQVSMAAESIHKDLMALSKKLGIQHKELDRIQFFFDNS